MPFKKPKKISKRDVVDVRVVAMFTTNENMPYTHEDSLDVITLIVYDEPRVKGNNKTIAKRGKHLMPVAPAAEIRRGKQTRDEINRVVVTTARASPFITDSMLDSFRTAPAFNVDLDFLFKRPKKAAQRFPTTKADRGNCLKFYEDAISTSRKQRLEGDMGVIDDDGCIVDGRVRKAYDVESSVVISVTRLR